MTKILSTKKKEGQIVLIDLVNDLYGITSLTLYWQLSTNPFQFIYKWHFLHVVSFTWFKEPTIKSLIVVYSTFSALKKKIELDPVMPIYIR